jgi:hypothetical protein
MGKEIKALYTSKGLTPPKGKGEHTMAFHRMATKIMESGTDKNIAYATSMKHLGRNKAVNKSHWRGAVDRKLKGGE